LSHFFCFEMLLFRGALLKVLIFPLKQI